MSKGVVLTGALVRGGQDVQVLLPGLPHMGVMVKASKGPPGVMVGWKAPAMPASPTEELLVETMRGRVGDGWEGEPLAGKTPLAKAAAGAVEAAGVAPAAGRNEGGDIGRAAWMLQSCSQLAV